MARMARVIAEGVAHHVTQRGNARRVIFGSGADCLVYLNLLRQYSILYGCSLIGYCLMSNHVHLIAVPDRADSLALLLRDVHGRYATYLNSRESASGHVWQGRYYSCPLGPTHLWTALRYVEHNPVRARMVARPEDYKWSSSAAHCGRSSDIERLDLEVWETAWSAVKWESFLRDAAEDEAELDVIRRSTHTGRPLGSDAFVRQIEQTLGRTLAQQKGGRPRKRQQDATQQSFEFVTAE